MAFGAVLSAAAGALHAQTDASTPVIKIKANQVTAKVSPMLYGLMTEEINFSYEGGLYAELVRNRTFKEDAQNPAHWMLVQEGGGTGAMSLDTTQPLNDALPISLKLVVIKAESSARVGVANEGFWGIPVKPATTYRASFCAKADKGFQGSLTVSIVTNDKGTTLASAQVSQITDQWQKYEATLTTAKDVIPSAANHLVLSASSLGTVWFNVVSLFPPTYNDRPNGNRKDLMQLMGDMKPAFLRFPGGNYLEGNTIATRFDWKKTLGDISQRPGHMNDGWKYWSTDGMGLLEFLDWCEDLHMEPLLAVYAGYSLKGEHVTPGPDLEPFVNEALEEIEYVTGDEKTTWGARRAKDGHPKPFALQYVEIGNEDWFDKSGSYDGRFAQIYDAIKAKYPNLQLIATAKVSSRKPDVIDEHYYRRPEQESELHAHDYDKRLRTGPKVFVGEWATRVGSPTPNMAGALGDAAWMTGMERNSDLVIASCYAPLFVNVNKGAMQWPTDLIGYDALNSYGSPAYYAQKMFSLHHGDTVLDAQGEGIPTQAYQPPAPRRRPGSEGTPPPPPPAKQVETLFFDATRDSKTGMIFLKVVNSASTSQPVRVEMTGLTSVDADGEAVEMKASSSDDTNSITEPTKIVPTTTKAEGLAPSFTRTFPPYSITVLRMNAK